MNREYHRWSSPSLRRDMEMLVFGYSGLPVLIFPTSMGKFFEWEDRSMVGALGPSIESGFLHLYCIDSIDAESWYNKRVHPHDRVMRHLQYERYILEEVLPLIESQLAPGSDPRIAVTGASLGAFHAALLAFRHPQIISRMIALSGMYENSRFLDGYSDLDAYLTNPLAFLPDLTDPRYLEPLIAADLIIVTGAGDPHVDQSRALSEVLQRKGIGNTLDVWDGWSHDWPYWKAMITKYL